MSLAAEIFHRLSQPLEPIATDEVPRLPRISGVRAVLFDIYGTLVVSGSGDIGTTGEATRGDALATALGACGLPALECPADRVISAFVEIIERHHAKARQEGIEHPEIDILEVWSELWSHMLAQQWVPSTAERIDLELLAVEFEARANPVWPMPRVEECLVALRTQRIAMGVISNAQFFTPELFPALFGKSLDEMGFDPQLRYYSYEHRHAKPSETMYRRAAAALEKRGISPPEVLYVGNDLRNDVLPACGVGFRTVLYAGDARSLRWRKGDSMTEGIMPDAVITQWPQLLEICLPFAE